jgi:hypothetical protein
MKYATRFKRRVMSLALSGARTAGVTDIGFVEITEQGVAFDPPNRWEYAVCVYILSA